MKGQARREAAKIMPFSAVSLVVILLQYTDDDAHFDSRPPRSRNRPTPTPCLMDGDDAISAHKI